MEKKEKSRIVLFLYCNTSRTTIILLCTSNWCSFYSSYGNKKFRDIACNAGNYTLHCFTARRHLGTLPLNHIVWCIFVLWVPMEHRASQRNRLLQNDNDYVNTIVTTFITWFYHRSDWLLGITCIHDNPHQINATRWYRWIYKTCKCEICTFHC